MARVTVEDCIQKVPNRFNLVLLSAQRARQISAGLPLTVERDNDKNPVVSLREIADETVKVDELEENLIVGLQRYVENDVLEEEEDIEFDMMEGEKAAVTGPKQAAPEKGEKEKGEKSDKEKPEAEKLEAENLEAENLEAEKLEAEKPESEKLKTEDTLLPQEEPVSAESDESKD